MRPPGRARLIASTRGRSSLTPAAPDYRRSSGMSVAPASSTGSRSCASGMLNISPSSPASRNACTCSATASRPPTSAYAPRLLLGHPAMCREGGELGLGLRIGLGDQQPAEARLRDLGRVPSDLVAVRLEHGELVTDRGEVAEEVARVAALGDEPQRPLLPAAADQDRGPAGSDRTWDVEGVLDAVVGAVEAGCVLAEHEPADLHGLRETLEALARRGELEPVSPVLLLVPGRADAEDRATRRDDVERRHDLREQRRIAIGDAGDERAETDVRRTRGEGPEQGVPLEHRVRRRAHHGDLVEVVHHPDRVESGALRGQSDLGDRARTSCHPVRRGR